MTGKITYKDEKDGLTYEWDEGKKAWFPALGEDFMAMYQLNYGFTKYVTSHSPIGSAVDPDPYPDWIRIQWDPWIRIQEGNDPQT